MNMPTVIVGVAAAIFGISTIVVRQTHPHLFKKLEPMKRQWGEVPGYVIHFIAYSIVPLAFGITMIFHGLKGGSLFGQ